MPRRERGAAARAAAAQRAAWDFDVAQAAHRGFPEHTLQALCRWEQRRQLRSPWLYHVSEMYSLGKCLRRQTGWPFWLPVPVYSDHGAVRTLIPEAHERDNTAALHLTWNRFFFNRNQAEFGAKLVHVTHPWVPYRRMMGYRRHADARGTLVFFAHSGADSFYAQDLAGYLAALRALPDRCRPLVFCVHPNDVARGLHEPLRAAGMPLVTAGSAGSDHFVDRFYGLAACFRYATSNTGGSELAYLVEMGVPYFLFGPPPSLQRRRADGALRAAAPAADDLAFEALKRKLFEKWPPAIDDHQLNFVHDLLGRDSPTSPNRLRWLLLRELGRHLPLLGRRAARRVAGALLRRCGLGPVPSVDVE